MKDELIIVKKLFIVFCDVVFVGFENLINIVDYLFDNYRNIFIIEFEKYEVEWEVFKNG